MRTSTVLLLIAVSLGCLRPATAREIWLWPDQTLPPNQPRTTPPTFKRATTITPEGAFSSSTKPSNVVFQIPNCSCQATPQFNPVCGSDGNTYVNSQKLRCARRCGFNVRETRLGSCTPDVQI